MKLSESTEMTENQTFGEQYLASLLQANPGSPEELAEAKQKIELYFRSREKSNKAAESTKAHGASGVATRATAPSRPRPAAASKIKRGAPRALSPENQYRLKLGFTWFLIIFVPLLSVGAKALGLHWLFPALLCLLGLYLWQRMRANFSNLFAFGDPDLQRLALAGLVLDKNIYPQAGWSRKCGMSNVPQFKEKWDTLDKNIQIILRAEDLNSACGPAEECLSVINYFNHIKTKHNRKFEKVEHLIVTEIDPLNTLINRLIEEHEWQYADQLSQHYLGLLNPKSLDSRNSFQ